jgi:hypothetical protein
MITLSGLTQRQRLVAELLWATEDSNEVERLCRLDSDARTVRELMIAAALDEVKETHLAERVLVDIMSK